MKWLNTLGVMYVYIIILYSYGVDGRMAWYGKARHGTKYKAKRKKSQQIAYLFDEMVRTSIFPSNLTSDFYTKFMMFHRRIEVMFLLCAN